MFSSVNDVPSRYGKAYCFAWWNIIARLLISTQLLDFSKSEILPVGVFPRQQPVQVLGFFQVA
jgi:hypothetical protein